MPRVFIPPPLRDLTGGVREVELAARTLGEIINQLEARFPGVGARLCDSQRLAAGLSVSLDGKIASPWLSTPVDLVDEIHFLPAIAGG